jgi:hypothetical protein
MEKDCVYSAARIEVQLRIGLTLGLNVTEFKRLGAVLYSVSSNAAQSAFTILD